MAAISWLSTYPSIAGRLASTRSSAQFLYLEDTIGRLHEPTQTQLETWEFALPVVAQTARVSAAAQVDRDLYPIDRRVALVFRGLVDDPRLGRRWRAPRAPAHSPVRQAARQRRDAELGDQCAAIH
jgi:hypothetical protein